MQNVTLWGETLRLLVELAATVAFALSGILAGARQRLDAVGVVVVAFLAAFGGGTLRDLLLDERPVFWVRHVERVCGVLGLSVLAMLFLRTRHFQVTERAMQWPDALGLGLFAATGHAGGVLRDVVCNQIPSAFSDHRPYAVCAFVGGWVYVGLWAVAAPGWLALVACVGVTAGLRGLALWRNWQLPPWRL